MPINLHIEHLVLEGAPFAASDSRSFRVALEREIAAQSATIDTHSWSSVRHISVNAPDISPAAPASLQSWAAASARSLLAAVAPTNR